MKGLEPRTRRRTPMPKTTRMMRCKPAQTNMEGAPLVHRLMTKPRAKRRGRALVMRNRPHRTTKRVIARSLQDRKEPLLPQ